MLLDRGAFAVVTHVCTRRVSVCMQISTMSMVNAAIVEVMWLPAVACLTLYNSTAPVPISVACGHLLFKGQPYA